jgi:hypothetical protein
MTFTITYNIEAAVILVGLRTSAASSIWGYVIRGVMWVPAASQQCCTVYRAPDNCPRTTRIGGGPLMERPKGHPGSP